MPLPIIDNCVQYIRFSFQIYNVENGHEVTCPNNFSGAWMISTQFSPNNQQIITLSKSIQVTTKQHTVYSA